MFTMVQFSGIIFTVTLTIGIYVIKLNGEPVNVTIFPDKTSQVWKLPHKLERSAKVEWIFESESEFMHLAQLKDLLDVELVEWIDLHISYLPYARQDKPISNSTTFALSTFAKLLNNLNFRKVTFDDVHSRKALHLIKNSQDNAPKIYSICQNAFEGTPVQICYPDFGASERYKLAYSVVLEKERDQLTGELKMKPLSQSVSGDFLIVDDICDRGGTFILAAKELYKAGASSVHLYVSHGIFSGGLDILRDAGIKRIFTLKGEVK